MRKEIKLRNLRYLADLSDIGFPIGSVNPSGIKDTVYAIPKQFITKWPTIVDDFETAVSIKKYTTLEGSFQLKAGKTWIRIYTTQGKGKINFETQGETDCKMVVNKATLSYPKITDEARALAKFAINGDLVYCVKHDGKYYIIGSEDYRSESTPTGDSGDAPGSAKGMPFEISSPDVTPLPRYEGTLALSDGTLDCSDGSFTPSDSANLTVTYDGNGNTGGTAPTDSSSPYSSGDTVTVIGNTGSLEKTGKTFSGWNTKADGSGTTYTAAQTFTITASTTLYAKWTD